MTVTDPNAAAVSPAGDPNTQAMLSAVRSILIGIGGILAAHGITAVGGVSIESIIGIITMILPLLWGVFQKYQAERKTQARETVAVQAGVQATQARAPIVSAIPAALITPSQAQTIIAIHAPG